MHARYVQRDLEQKSIYATRRNSLKKKARFKYICSCGRRYKRYQRLKPRAKREDRNIPQQNQKNSEITVQNEKTIC